jgi:carotenoid cleavage dioxygenase-like enzyme
MAIIDKKPSVPHRPHPYLHGNFALIQKVRSLTHCSFSGTITEELSGGQYERNGGNPAANEDSRRDAHWFDGDAMLHGVVFKRQEDGSVRPGFANQYIMVLTKVSLIGMGILATIQKVSCGLLKRVG